MEQPSPRWGRRAWRSVCWGCLVLLRGELGEGGQALAAGRPTSFSVHRVCP